MFGIGLALVLVVCGIVFIVLGFHVQEADRKTQAAVLFKWMPKATASETSASFLNCSTFTFAMDAPEFTSFYLWNLTNAEDLLRGSRTVQPKLTQVGPYTYEKRTRKLNVTFHAIEDDAYDSNNYGAVSYQVASTYHFSTERSSGSENDLVVTLNASYVRHLTKLHAQTGRSERFLAAEFAHAHIRDYVRHLQSDFLAATKLRALRALLPEMVASVKREGMTAVINRQRRRVGDANLPAALVRMHAVARTEQIPVMLRDVYRDQADVAIPRLLTKQYDLARRQAVPRVLSNIYTRLQVEAVPALLGRQIETQQTNFVPRTLGSLSLKIQRIAFPYVLQEVFERACLEVVPFVLRAIKNEIVARDMANNQATLDNARLAVINLWRQQGSTPTDLDAWIDDSPTNQERTGFELLPATSALELSLEVATLLLGSRPSNLRFSLVDYDPVQTAADGLDGPQTTATGFAIWKQVVALNETAIGYVLEGVNNDVALVGDFLTREQLMAIRDYIIIWAQSDITQRDRQRFWRKAFDKRTTSSDVSDPDVDLDLERVGVQSGFSLQPLSVSSSGASASVAQQAWNSSIEYSFVHPAGFTRWLSVVDGTATASSSGLLAGITGVTNAEVSVISSWIKTMLDDGFIRRRALRHWTDGTCMTVMQLPREDGCLRYDLEPNIEGIQLGFEMNPDAVTEIGSGISESARDSLWDVTEDVSFLIPAHSSDTKYYAQWLRAIRKSNYARLINDSQQLTTLAVTKISAQAIGKWLSSWAQNELNKLAVYYWWLRSTCWTRVELSKTQVGSATVTTGQSECKETSSEQEQSTVSSSSNVSPFFTDVRTYQVTIDTCTTTGSTFTKTQTIYTLQARMYSCEVVSTGLADDQDDGTVGFELVPLAQNDADRISLAAAIVLWNPDSELSFRSKKGYKRWIGLAESISGGAAGVTAETQAVADDLNAAIVGACQDGIKGGGPSSGIFNVSLVDTSCAQVTAVHVAWIAAWVKEQSGSQWIKNSLLDQWRRGVAGDLDIEPYRDGLQSGLELTTGCESTLSSLSASECSTIISENGTQYEVPREALDLWDTTHKASFLTTKGFALWEALAVAIESNDAPSKDSAQKDITRLCSASSTWEIWMERVFQWLQRWKTNEHLERDVLGHWLYARCPTTAKIERVISEPTPQTSTVSSCTESYTATLSSTLDEIQQFASRPVTFFDANVAQTAALIQPTKTVDVTESWTKCEPLASSSFTKTVGTRQSRNTFQACNLLSILATLDMDPSEVTPMDATFELNRTSDVAISIEVAQVLWDSQSDFSLLNSTSFFEKWYPAIDRSTALQKVENDMDTLVGSSSPCDLSVLQDYLLQWESSDAAAVSVCSLWISTNVASVDVDIHQAGDQRGFELDRNTYYKGTANSLTLPTLEQAKMLWQTDSVYSIIRSDSSTDDAGLPTGFRAWEEMFEGVDYEAEHLVSQYPLTNQVTQPTAMTHSLNDQKRAQILAAMITATSLSEAQIRGVARWLFNWAIDDSLRDFVLFQWATGETFRGDPKRSLDFASHLERLYSFPITSDMNHDYFTAGSTVLSDASRNSLRKLWDVAITGSLLDPASRIVWCLINVTDSDGNTRTPCAHLLDGYGVLETAAFDEFVVLVQPSIPSTPIVQATADLSALALSFLEQTLELTIDQLLVIARWYRQVRDSSLFFQVYQLDKWSSPRTEASKDPLEFGYELAFVLPWNTAIARSVSVNDLIANVAYVGVPKTQKTIRECANSLSLLYTLWDFSNPASFLHPTGVSTWLSYARGEVNETELIGSSNPTSKVINDQNLTDSTVSCLFQLVGHWLKSWANHPSARLFIEEFWIAPITQGSTSIAALFPSATDMANAFPLGQLSPNSARDATVFSTTEWWVAAARVLLDVSESVALTNPEEGFALWRTLLIDCFSSDRVTGKCEIPQHSSQYEMSKTQVLKVLSRSLLDRIVNVSSTLSGVSDDVLLVYTISMTQEQIVPWLVKLLDHMVLEQYVLERVRLANGDEDTTTGPLSFVDLAAVQFINGSVSGANYSVRDGSTGRLILNDNGTRSERFPHQEFVFDTSNSLIVQQMSSFLPGFAELSAFCTYSGQDLQFLYDQDTKCSLGTEYTLSISDAQTLWTAFGPDDTTVWSWPKPNISASTLGSGAPSPSALPKTTRSALLLDAFLAQPFETAEKCTTLMKTVVEAYDSDWSDQEKQQVCVDRTGEAGVGSSAVYLQLPGLQDLHDKPVSIVQDLQAYLLYVATKFEYEPSILGLRPSPPREEAALSTSLTYPIGGYFAALMVSQILFASPPSEADESPNETPLWSNSTAMERGASTFDLVVPLEDNAALYRKGKSVVGRLVAVDSSTLMNAWGEKVELSAVRVTDGSQFTTAVLIGQGENSVTSVEFPPQKLYFYWGYARRVAQITFDSSTTRFGKSMMRYVMNWTLPSRLPTGVVSTSAPTTPSLNVSFLYDDLPLMVQSSSSSDAASSVFDIDPQTGAVVHRRLVWQLTAQVGDRQVLDVWHSDLAAGWLPILWIEEETGMSATASATMTNLGPFTAKTLSLLGFVVGACVIVVGCVLGYISVRRARLIRRQRFLAIVPEAIVNGGDVVTLKDVGSVDIEEGADVADAPTEPMQATVDRTEGIDDVGEDEIRRETTTRL
ncbi:hypothetical protein L914_19110 [Phytophthora nicotianae]|uniref:Uncharacterized protein n=1 Tax=Phytophthora nicotianae TaxID=4792 RepID=W2MDC1_PHYNI|nr:hypothetical protein L914_19110 [Phytophthora nicotianae]